MILRKVLVLMLAVLTSCNRIETGLTLKEADLKRIQQLNLLDDGEKIKKFYSEYKNEVAGNFFTDRRIAKYWIDENDKTKDVIAFAFYQDIQSIDTIYYAGSTYCAYMLVTTTKGSQFKVSVDGKPVEIKLFFEEALSRWKQNRTAR